MLKNDFKIGFVKKKKKKFQALNGNFDALTGQYQSNVFLRTHWVYENWN